jgi:hypothetical protein
MGVSTVSLAADLLEEIARDDLYDAVLDRDASPEGARVAIQ